MLVELKLDFTFARFDHDWHDLVVKTIFFLSLNGAAMRFCCASILRCTRDTKLVGNIFCGHAHVHAAKRVMQSTGHHVEHNRIAHPSAKTLGLRQIARTTHRLGAATNGHLSVA